jgi:hypothetical protein
VSIRFLLLVAVLVCTSIAQRRVDPRNTYNRIICIVPLVGKGVASDPVRPQYAPWPPSQDPNGIISYYFVPTDNGKSAVVEFVARNRTAFQSIFNDKSVKFFEKGRSAKGEIEAVIKQQSKNFNLDTFGMVM